MGRKKQKKLEISDKQQNAAFKNKKINIVYKTVFVVFIPLILFIITLSNFIKDNSDLNIELIEPKIDTFYGMEVLRLGVNNHSQDAKKLTKAVLKISEIREDDSYNFNMMCENSDDGLTMSVYNSGWSDLYNVHFSVLPQSEFHQNLWEPEKYSKTIDVMKYGEYYELGTLTINDLKNKTKESKIEIHCEIEGENKSSVLYDEYSYDKNLDKITLAGRGGPTDIYNIDYCIDTNNGAYEYEIPVTYTCDAHDYEEIEFIFTANRSCHIRYSLELYSNNKCLFKSQEKGTYIEKSSLGYDKTQ